MSTITGVAPDRLRSAREELAKLPAFVRRDVLTLLSYRFAFLGDWLNLLVQLVTFSFIGKMVDPTTLPAYGGTGGYLEFVSIGIALTSFMQVGLGRAVSVLRTEQYMGTLESLLITPTAPTTIQLGSVVYDALYVPIRTAVFLFLVAVLFGVDFHLAGLLPAAVVLLLFIPFVWGLGVISAAALLTLRRGSGLVGIGAVLLTIGSGAYFPTGLFPGWLQPLVEANPIAVALETCRKALLGGAGWADVLPSLLLLLPATVVALFVGLSCLRLAIAREQRHGTLGLY